MECTLCGAANESRQNFCGQCGQPLLLICSACSTPNPPTSKFCGECGSSLGEDVAGSETPARSERRMVSVLFADLVGFTPFSEGRDPEEVRSLLTGYFDRSREIVERFGGTVDKFIGDAVMAVWGAVEAHEDDAERAVRAGLELVDMVADLAADLGAPDLALRVGVLTGETSVGPGGNEKGLVVGDLVNTASRLQSIAEPGTVLVGQPTAGLVAGAIAMTSLGEQRVKGKEAPVPAYRAGPLIGERGGRRRAGGIEPPFVGREDELRLLKDQVHAAGRERRARLVSIVGEAGIGKSRLIWELQKYVDGIAEDVYWHSGRSPSYGAGLTYWALGEMLRSRAGIAEADDPAKSRMKLRTAVAEYVATEEDRQWLEPRLAAVLGLAEMPPGERSELFGAIRSFFHHIADRGSTVLVFEDLHWADAGLLDLIRDLVDRSQRHPILVITLARPDLLDADPGWGAGRRNTLALSLAPLSDAAMGELVRSTVPGVDDGLVATVVGKAAGVPLYAVEFLRTMLGSESLVRDGDGFRLSGDVDLALPDSLQAVIGARLDRLAADDRSLIQDASVLGQSFTVAAMEAITGEGGDDLRRRLAGLVAQELLEYDDDPRSPERGHYRFVQSLIREVAYGRLSRADRLSRHVRVAEHFQSLDEVELAGIVAGHYLAAHEVSGGDDDLLARGRTALIEAARRANALRSFAQAHALAAQAVELCDSDADLAATHELAAQASGWVGDVEVSQRHARAAAAAYHRAGDDEGVLRAVAAEGFVLNSYFRSGEAVRLLEPVYQGLAEVATAGAARLGLELARAYMLDQRHAESVVVSDAVLPVAERLLDRASVLDGIITRATALPAAGRVVEANAALTGVVAVADEEGLQAQAIRALNNLGVGLRYTNPRQAQALSADLVERASRFGAQAWTSRATLDYIDGLVAGGQFHEARELLLDLEGEDLDPTTEQRRRTFLAIVDLVTGTGAAEVKMSEIEAILEEWAAIDDAQVAFTIGSTRALAALFVGDWETAATAAAGNPAPEAIVYALAASIWRRDRDALETTAELFRSIVTPGPLRDVLDQAAAGAFALLDGDMETAASQFADALTIAERCFVGSEYALLSVAVAKALGHGHEAGAAAGRAALTWIRESGAVALETAWSAALPVETGESASA